ncbi:UDP-glycosyltransferase UGT5-like isoform X5 [Bicyclus anynana]|uniref:UDP-glucuronosyltransferase n=1 Tax=Bicyclus anynana TaxID=110368 RepID=A0A6J1PBA4_BICAN|nr:UDP-glycosyltransferase UGT5-like isoform X5 [Bicyclus anynana]
MRSALVCLAIIALSNYVYGARILGLFPHTGKSHQMVFEPLLRKLAERGHHVTVASFFPLKNPPANYTDVSFEGIATLGIESFDLNWYENPDFILRVPIVGRLMKQLAEFHPLAGMALGVCSKAVDWPPLTEALEKDYDVVFVENFNSDCMLGLLHVHGINAPVIALLSSSLMPWSADRIGVTDNPSYVPVLSSDYSSRMTYWQRVENTFLKMYHKLWFRYLVQVKEQEIIEKHFSRKIPDLEDIARNVSLMMLNTHFALNGPKPLVPGLIQVGGMHLDPTRKAIPQYIEKFLNESEHGVVLFSFGSLIRTATLPKYKEEMIVNSLSKLKQRVIWKYEDSAEQGNLTGNILRVRWLPQYELLQHNKIHAFIAHGGLLGMTEAVSAGKPMVVVPFFGDQPANGAAAAAAGFAKVVPYYDLSEEALDDAIQTVLSAEMRMNARRVSKMWKDRESSPLDTAVFWTERVIRWGHAAPLHTAARELAFYELALLDVAAAYILAIIIIHIILWFLLSKIIHLFVKEPKQKLH